MKGIPFVEELDVESVPRGTVGRFHLSLVRDPRGMRIAVPVLVARGVEDGPTLGLTAAMHGDELNGMRVIHRVFEELDPRDLRGTVIGVPVVNVPGFLEGTRYFNDGVDLNRIMPGKKGGNSSQVYAYRFIERVVKRFDRLIDLHTASFGRVNSLYVRADVENDETGWMARAQHPQILLHNPGHDGTLRAAAMDLGIPAITVEVGDPNRFQKKMIRYGFMGVANVLAHLKMVDLDEELPSFEPVHCSSSQWLYTDVGGLLQVHVELGDIVEEGQRLATVTDIFGEKLTTYAAPSHGIIIGKSTHPVNQTGSRIVHLGAMS